MTDLETTQKQKEGGMPDTGQAYGEAFGSRASPKNDLECYLV